MGDAYVSRVTCGSALIESFHATLNRGYVANTATAVVITRNDESCPFTLGENLSFTARTYTTDGNEKTATVFSGYVFKIEWERLADRSHKRWRVHLTDVLSELESYDVDIRPGRYLQEFYKTIIPPPFAGTKTGDFSFQGNALQGLREFGIYCGWCPYGSDGNGLNQVIGHSNLRAATGGTCLPGSYGVTVRARAPADGGDKVAMSLAYNTGEQQWWIPFAVKDEGETTLFVLFMTYVKHAQSGLDVGDVTALYFDDQSVAFGQYSQEDYEEYIMDNNLSELGLTFLASNPFFVYPENDNVYLILAVPFMISMPTSSFDEDTTSGAINIGADEAISAQLISWFKKTLPDYLTIHFESSAAEIIMEASYGSDSDADIIEIPAIAGEAALDKLAEYEYKERVYNAESTYVYEFGMVGSIPVPGHFPGGSESYSVNSTGMIVERTEINYSISDGVVITVVARGSEGGGSGRVFPRGVVYRKIAESYGTEPSMIEGIKCCWIDRASGRTKIKWMDDTVSEYTSNEIQVGANGVLLWKNPLVSKQKGGV